MDRGNTEYIYPGSEKKRILFDLRERERERERESKLSKFYKNNIR